ncbi:hypothetical protein [Aliarcobacter butzleri]|uniref:hypothetical protein n=1 Tax=Aliarcobacter butzleri TaxID=28197 RepID=UPI003AF993A6
MASHEWNIIDKYSLKSNEYYCAFLDILGYKEKSDKFFAGEYNLKGRFKRAIKVSLKAMQDAKDLKFVNSSKLKIEFFSDSIILTHPVDENKIDALHNILHFSRILIAHLNLEELFVRGGIAKGEHIFETNEHFSFLSSKALEKAYLLESQKAIYPRVVIDKDVLKNIDEYNLSEFVIKDKEDFILHYSPQSINRDGDNLDDIFLELEDIHKIYINTNEDKVKEKYLWIIKYYYWTLTNIKNIDLNKFDKFYKLINQYLGEFRKVGFNEIS